MKIAGNAEDRSVFVDGQRLWPETSQKVFNHSPDGFSWGYGGSGPAQLALALTLVAAHKMNIAFEIVRPYYQEVKSQFVASWPMNQDFDGEYDIEGYLENRIKQANIAERMSND